MGMRGDAELWRQAETTLDCIKAGEIKGTRSQVNRLQELIQGREAWADADAKMKQAMIGLLYERQSYFGKLCFLEQLCATNNWAHPLLVDMARVLYKENETFRLESRIAASNTV
jgi:hypothetical protein